MIWSLYHFYRATQKTTNTAVQEMSAHVRANLLAMRERYVSSAETARGSVRYAKAVFRNHAGLKKLLP